MARSGSGPSTARPMIWTGSPRTPARRLSSHLTTFVGRQQELDFLLEALAQSRLVTVTGPAGVGKTRLAEQAFGLLPALFGRPFGLALGELEDPESLTAALAEAVVGAGFEGDPWTLTVRALRAQPAALLLDGCEHLIDGVAGLAARLLEACSELVLLATSREPLGVDGERRFPLGPLPVPPADETGPDLLRSPALALFADRARLAGADAPEWGDTTAVAGICRALDGLPLAIELAAARTAHMTPGEILARLDSRLDLLVSRDRTRPVKQRSLRAALDWSHELLDTRERALFRRLAVFRGGFDLAGVEALAERLEGAEPVLETLTSLVDKSLVYRVSRLDGTARFALLDSMRAYGLERLTESGEREATESAHADHVALVIDQLLATIAGPDPEASGRAQVKLRAESANVSAALQHLLASDLPRAGRLLARLGDGYWIWRGDVGGGQRLIGQVLARLEGEPVLRARLLAVDAHLAWSRWEYGRARAELEEAVRLARRQGDPGLTAELLSSLGFVLFGSDDEADAEPILEEALTLARAEGDRSRLAAVLGSVAVLHLSNDQLEDAVAVLEEQLDLLAGASPRQRTFAVGQLGYVRLRQGRLTEARELLRQALDSRRDDSRRSIANCLLFMVELAASAGHHQRAMVLAGIADRLFAESTTHPASLPLGSRERGVAMATRQLRGRAMQLRRAGAALSDAAGFRYAMSEDDSAPELPSRGGLTRREAEVAALVARGLTNREVASALTLSVRTVDAHLEHVRDKLQVRSRAQIAAWLVASGSEMAAARHAPLAN